MMEKIQNAVYTKELRGEAVELVIEGGLSVPGVGRRLSVASSTLRQPALRRRPLRPGHGSGAAEVLCMQGRACLTAAVV
jgi:transposase-like protein